MRITKLIGATTLILASAFSGCEKTEPGETQAARQREEQAGQYKPTASTPDFAADRFEEAKAVHQQVPHERLRVWPIGEKTGMELLAKRGTTDEQLATLVNWYVSVGNATYIVIFDNPAEAEARDGGVMANYSEPTLIRFLYRHDDSRHGDFIGQRTIKLSPRKIE